jgi:hypothetical protein
MQVEFFKKHKKDLILVVILVVLLLASAIGVVLYRASIPKHEVVVTSGGTELFRVPLSENATYGVVDGQAVKFDNPDITLADMGDEAEESKHHINIIRVEDGSVFVRESNCQNQICVNTGKLSADNYDFPIACLPHDLVITIE